MFTLHNDAAFNQFFKDINQYVTTKTAGTIPEWTHIPQMDRSYLLQAYIDWYSSYVLTLDPHASHIAKETKRVRLIAERALENFVNRYLCLEPVTGQDRGNMGLPMYGCICAAHKEIEAKEMAVFAFNLSKIRKMLVDFFNKGAAARKRRTAA